MPAKITITNTAKLVDELGAIKAQIAVLTRAEEKLKTQLKEYGPGEYNGNTFRATVTESERATLDMDAVRAKLSPQFIAAHTTITPCVTVRVTAQVRE
jgi:ribose 5-phosphate isomerase